MPTTKPTLPSAPLVPALEHRRNTNAGWGPTERETRRAITNAAAASVVRAPGQQQAPPIEGLMKASETGEITICIYKANKL